MECRVDRCQAHPAVVLRCSNGEVNASVVPPLQYGQPVLVAQVGEQGAGEHEEGEEHDEIFMIPVAHTVCDPS